MKIKIALSLSFLCLPLTLPALETDNYLAWQVELPDAAEDVNAFMESKIQEALAIANSKNKTYSCEAITFKIANQFRTTPISKSLESFVSEDMDKSKVFPEASKFLDMSILSGTRFYLKYSGLSPNLQINGYYLGADKLSHFASTGRRYLKRYLKKKKKGFSEEDSVQAAIRYGLLNEASVLGWWASGVFSYADMEANYQGLVYYKKMCMNESDNYLNQDEKGKWILVKTPDMRDYVNPYWDESYNQSYFTASSWPVVKQWIQKKYCGMKLDAKVSDRFSYYESAQHTSFSIRYIQKLQEAGFRNAPVPSLTQDVSDACQEAAPVEENAVAVTSE